MLLVHVTGFVLESLDQRFPSLCSHLCKACGSAGSAFVSKPQGCEFESRSSHFSFLLLAREIYAHASEHSRLRGCPFTR